MNRNGFTLIEILAVITILIVVILVVTPKVLEIIQEQKQKAYDIKVESIITLAKGYANKNSYDLVWDDNVAKIYLADLIDAGLVNPPVKNPLTNENIDPNEFCVYVYKDGAKTFFLLEDMSLYTNVTTFNKTYGGTLIDNLINSIEVSDGYLLVGASNSSNGDITDGNSGATDAVVIKVDKNGVIQWNKTFGGTSDEYFAHAVTTTDGYLLAGRTSSNDGDVTDGNNGNADIWVVKINFSGTKQWDKTYGGNNQEDVVGLVTTPEADGFIIGGETASSNGDVTDGNNGGDDIWAFEINNSGVIQWNKTYGGTNDDQAHKMIAVTGGYAIVGHSHSSDGDITDGNNGIEDALLIKINASGTKLWDKTYGGTSSDYFNAVTEDDDGNLIMVGDTYSSDGDITDGNNGEGDVLIIKTTNTGTKLWDQTYGSSGDDWSNWAFATDSNTFIICGNTYGSDLDVKDSTEGDSDAWLLKITSSGAKLYDQVLGGTAADWVKNGFINSEGMLIMTANANSSNGDITDGNNGSQDMWFMKLNPNFTY